MDQRVRAFRVTDFIRELAPSIREFRGELDDGTPVYIKECCSRDVESASDQLLSEASRLSLMTSAHVVTRFCHKLRLSGNDVSFQLVLEWMDRSLEQEIRARTEPWMEEELWQGLRVLVELLARGEELGFAHRNLNPKTVFLTSSGQLKLGDFSCSMAMPGQHQFPLAARFSYMAPEVQEAYIAVRRAEHNVAGDYDEFKGDVYSLGLTLLRMARRKQFGKAPLSEVDALPYSRDFCGFLRLMLQPKPSFRPNFRTLLKTLLEVRPEYYRPSSRSTADSGRLLSSRISDLLEKKIGYEDLWIRELNESEKMSENLCKLLAFERQVHVDVVLALVCHTCRILFQVDVLSAFRAENLLVCRACLRGKYLI